VPVNSVIKLNNYVQKIMLLVGKMEKDGFQKLKESSVNPLMHLRNGGDSSSSSSKSNDFSSDDSNEDLEVLAARPNQSI